MATRGKVSTSSNGSSTPKYDVDVEARIKALEEKVFIEKESTVIESDRIAALEAKLDALIDCLNKNSSVTSHCPKNSEGKRQIQL